MKCDYRGDCVMAEEYLVFRLVDFDQIYRYA